MTAKEKAVSALESAIEETRRLNRAAMEALSAAMAKAIADANDSLQLADDFRCNYARQMLKVCSRQEAVAARFILTNKRKMKAATLSPKPRA